MNFKSNTPRPYLSWSQLALFERSPELYRRVYIFGEKTPETEAMRYGREVHEGIADDWGAIAANIGLPHYHLKEHELTAKLGKIKLLGRLDLYSVKSKIGEIKTSKSWTQSDADNSDQLTFYALIFYQLYKKIPALWLHWIETKDGVATGKVIHYKTKRTLIQLLNMASRAQKAWKGIQKLTEESLQI